MVTIRNAFGQVPAGSAAQLEDFNVSFPQSDLDDLKSSIKASRVGPATDEGLQTDLKYGVGAQWLSEAKEEWLKFDWRAVEADINTFPNYKLPLRHGEHIYTLHFCALFSTSPTAIPVLLLHGWPGSFLEFLPILHLLTTKYTPSTLPYHFIVPSLPGYTLSSPPPLDRDFRLEDAAALLNDLMKGLTFSTYAVQGGDVGSKIARVLGGTSNGCAAVHLNFCIMPDPGSIETDLSTLSAAEQAGLIRAQQFSSTGSAYALLHATRPSTIGSLLSSSPLALLAWIGEKFLFWSDVPHLSLHTILADVMLYWLTNSASTSLWPYRQLFTPGVIGAHENPEWYINKPLGFSWFPKEIAPVPRAWIETTGELVWFGRHERGGHFAALERPEALLDDLEEFLDQVWPRIKESM